MICSRWNYFIERTPEMFYIFGGKSRDITPEKKDLFKSKIKIGPHFMVTDLVYFK